MLAAMTHDEIEQLLLRGIVGRIGCHAEGRTTMSSRFGTRTTASAFTRNRPTD